MAWPVYGILVIMGLFILLLIFNPKLTCFGKRIKSPFYPLLRKKKREHKTTDYHFELVKDDEKREGKRKTDAQGKKKAEKKVDDYGFRLD